MKAASIPNQTKLSFYSQTDFLVRLFKFVVRCPITVMLQLLTASYLIYGISVTLLLLFFFFG
jgi:hypothetical protein